MKFEIKHEVPNFYVKDVHNNFIDLKNYLGKNILITFYRNVGCPVCNFHFHELEQNKDFFEANNTVLLAVYESTAQNILKYIEGESFYAIMIPNPDRYLYKLYQIEKSYLKIVTGLFKGAIHKMLTGKKLFKQKIRQDGSADRIGADFLVDTQGRIIIAHYPKYLGDDIKLTTIQEALNKQVTSII